MDTEVYRYTFAERVPFEEVEASLLLAFFATESLHGEAQVQLDASYVLDSEKRRCTIDARTSVGHDLNLLFVGFLSREFGDDAFLVEAAHVPRTKQEAHT